MRILFAVRQVAHPHGFVGGEGGLVGEYAGVVGDSCPDEDVMELVESTCVGTGCVGALIASRSFLFLSILFTSAAIFSNVCIALVVAEGCSDADFKCARLYDGGNDATDDAVESVMDDEDP